MTKVFLILRCSLFIFEFFLDMQGNVLYVTNLSSRIKEKNLEEKFKKYGSINSVKIVKDPYTK